MKKLFALILALVMGLSLVACGEQKQPDATLDGGDEPAAKEMTIVLIPKLVHEFYNYVLDGANQAVSELEAQGYKVNVVWSAPTAADVTEQTEKLEAAIALNPDYIGIAVINGESVKPILESAQSKGCLLYTSDAADEVVPV